MSARRGRRERRAQLDERRKEVDALRVARRMSVGTERLCQNAYHELRKDEQHERGTEVSTGHTKRLWFMASEYERGEIL